MWGLLFLLFWAMRCEIYIFNPGFYHGTHLGLIVAPRVTTVPAHGWTVRPHVGAWVVSINFLHRARVCTNRLHRLRMAVREKIRHLPAPRRHLLGVSLSPCAPSLVWVFPCPLLVRLTLLRVQTSSILYQSGLVRGRPSLP